MLEFFRNFFKSKAGIIVTLGFLVIIALAFASGDVAHVGTFGGVAGGDRVATVGDERISTSDLNRATNDALGRIKERDPTLTMQYFVKQNGLNRVLDELVDRFAIAGFANQIGLRVGTRLVDSEIAMVPAFHGADGKFDQKLYRQALQQQSLTDKAVREDLAKSLAARQILIPANFGVSVPQQQVDRYAVLLKERRNGGIAVLPSDAYVPKEAPTDAQLQQFYAANKDRYIRPERRVVRFATFGADALASARAPTDAEIAARFQRDSASYAAKESRSLSQVIAPTEAAAKAIAAEASAGTPLEAAARSKGLAAAKINSIGKADLATQASPAVANAAFAAEQGKLAQPAKSNLGWHVIRVDSISRTPARTLEQVRNEIVSQLTAELHQAALADAAAKIEDQFDQGSSLADTAKSLNLTIQSTKPITADGRVYGSSSEMAPPLLTKALSTAFSMEEGEPQLAEVEPGKVFIIFDVSDVIGSAPAPLAEIRNDVRAGWMASKGSEAARQAADRVLARIQKGMTLPQAMAEEKRPLPPPDKLDLGLEDLRKMGQRPPAAIVLLFSMAEGTSKRLAAPDERGWFVVQLDKIVPGKLEANDPAVAMTRQQLAANVSSEYADQLVKAIRKELTVTRNEKGIAAVRRQLTGGE
jgi:peptidyl-prolyl cis-trans isomerase D